MKGNKGRGAKNKFGEWAEEHSGSAKRGHKRIHYTHNTEGKGREVWVSEVRRMVERPFAWESEQRKTRPRNQKRKVGGGRRWEWKWRPAKRRRSVEIEQAIDWRRRGCRTGCRDLRGEQPERPWFEGPCVCVWCFSSGPPQFLFNLSAWP